MTRDPRPPVPAPIWRRLTRRQYEVLVLLAEGLSHAEIGRRLGISAAGVSHHVGALRAKFGRVTRAQIVLAAYAAGILRPRPRGGNPDAGTGR